MKDWLLRKGSVAGAPILSPKTGFDYRGAFCYYTSCDSERDLAQEGGRQRPISCVYLVLLSTMLS